MEAQRKPVTYLRSCRRWVGEWAWTKAAPAQNSGALGEKPGTNESCTQGFGQGLRNVARGQDPASQVVGRVSLDDLLTDQSRLGQPVPADGVKWLAGALGHVCGTSPSFWADSSGTIGPHSGKALHWSRS